MNIITDILFLTFLFICSFTDIKSREINIFICLLFSAAGMVLNIIGCTFNFYLLLSLLPGAFLLLLSIISPKNIGAGDGIMVITAGFFLNLQLLIATLSISFIILFFFSLIMIIIKRSYKNLLFPFAPFLLMGGFLQMLLQWRFY